MSRLTMALLQGRYAVSRLDPGCAIPRWAAGSFVSMTRTHEELSIVCPEDNVPDGDCRLGAIWFGSGYFSKARAYRTALDFARN